MKTPCLEEAVLKNLNIEFHFPTDFWSSLVLWALGEGTGATLPLFSILAAPRSPFGSLCSPPRPHPSRASGKIGCCLTPLDSGHPPTLSMTPAWVQVLMRRPPGGVLIWPDPVVLVLSSGCRWVLLKLFSFFRLPRRQVAPSPLSDHLAAVLQPPGLVPPLPCEQLWLLSPQLAPSSPVVLKAGSLLEIPRSE